MKKIIITAPTSIVAKNFINSVKKKYEIHTVGRRNSEVIYDFGSDEDLVLPIMADTVIHFAAVMESNNDKMIEDMINVNVRGLLKLLESAKKSGTKHIIYISSINAKIKKNSPYYTYYGLLKKQGEEIAELYCKDNNLDLCIVRPSQIIGPDIEFSKVQKLFYSILYNSINGKDITIYGKNDALRNYIYSENLYNLLQYVIDNHITGEWDAIGKNYKISDVANMAIKKTKSKSKIVYLENKPDLEDNDFSSNINGFEKLPVGEFIDLSQAIDIIINEMER